MYIFSFAVNFLDVHKRIKNFSKQEAQRRSKIKKCGLRQSTKMIKSNGFSDEVSKMELKNPVLVNSEIECTKKKNFIEVCEDEMCTEFKDTDVNNGVSKSMEIPPNHLISFKKDKDVKLIVKPLKISDDESKSVKKDELSVIKQTEPAKQFISIKEEKCTGYEPVEKSIETPKSELKSVKRDGGCNFESVGNCKFIYDDNGVKKSKITPPKEVTSVEKDKDVNIKAIVESLKSPKSKCEEVKKNGSFVITSTGIPEKQPISAEKEENVTSETILKSLESFKEEPKAVKNDEESESVKNVTNSVEQLTIKNDSNSESLKTSLPEEPLSMKINSSSIKTPIKELTEKKDVESKSREIIKKPENRKDKIMAWVRKKKKSFTGFFTGLKMSRNKDIKSRSESFQNYSYSFI